MLDLRMGQGEGGWPAPRAGTPTSVPVGGSSLQMKDQAWKLT